MGIEPPTGDTQRYMVSGLGKSNPDPYKDSPHFYSVNRGKRSIILDLKTDAGMEAMYALLDKADVFLSNYRYSSMRSLGLDAESVLARHPKLVVCPMSGWGLEGPDADRPVYDVAGFWARSGAAWAHTGSDGYPAILSPGFGDMTTGLAAVGGICAALFQSSRTGKGQILTTSLLRAGVHCNSWALSSFLALGRNIKWGERNRTGNAIATVYKAKDGLSFWIIGFEAARHWPATARAVGRPEWLDDARFKTPSDRRKNEKLLVSEFDAIFSTRNREEWAKTFDAEDVWWAPVQNPAEVVKDPQAIAAGAFVESPVSHAARTAGRDRVTMVAAPVHFQGGSAHPRRATPELGEHTEEIVRELGLDEDTTKALLTVKPPVRSKL